MATIKQIESLRLSYLMALHHEIEREMRRVIMFPRVGWIVKCMGCVTIYDTNGQPYDLCGEYAAKPPRYCDRLIRLAELDRDYFSVTGHPLRLHKVNGSVVETREW